MNTLDARWGDVNATEYEPIAVDKTGDSLARLEKGALHPVSEIPPSVSAETDVRVQMVKDARHGVPLKTNLSA